MNFTIFCVITMKFLITVLNLFIGYMDEQGESMSLRRCIVKSTCLTDLYHEIPDFQLLLGNLLFDIA